jgi:hypothetical protein
MAYMPEVGRDLSLSRILEYMPVNCSAFRVQRHDRYGERCDEIVCYKMLSQAVAEDGEVVIVTQAQSDRSPHPRWLADFIAACEAKGCRILTIPDKWLRNAESRTEQPEDPLDDDRF